MPASPEYASRFQFLKLSFTSPGVLHFELSRAPVNAFNEPFWREYGSAFDLIGSDPDVRVVVLSSAVKKAFSAGVDLSFLQTALEAEDGGRLGLLIRQQTAEFQAAIGAPSRCPVPVIAAVHSVAFGLAIDIIAACDVRYASSDVLFSIKEADVGLAADIGTLARLPKLTGNASHLAELALTARNFGAEEAQQLGLISKIVPGGHDEVVAAALAVAANIADKSPIAIVGTKRFIAHARDHSIEDALEYQTTWNTGAMQSPDMARAAMAALGKQKITFPPLGKMTRATPKL
ncbi:ClpP/crotonase [Auriscalpium vulgare]|uniref:ClpP/crotonase n=1 Tax=Auriscalpium vulgare TaxID=40419 RepID=A0ACB8RCI3_9AGAM|nr:ClpP/crotonase [Auriscalpium vulgare]